MRELNENFSSLCALSNDSSSSVSYCGAPKCLMRCLANAEQVHERFSIVPLMPCSWHFLRSSPSSRKPVCITFNVLRAANIPLPAISFYVYSESSLTIEKWSVLVKPSLPTKLCSMVLYVNSPAAKYFHRETKMLPYKHFNCWVCVYLTFFMGVENF